jgi:lysozyme
MAANYTNLLLTARQQADQRLASKGLAGSSFQSVDENDSDRLLPKSLVSKRPEVLQASAEEDDFMTKYFTRLREQNKNLVEEGSSTRALTDESGETVDILNEGDDVDSPSVQSAEDFIAGFENVKNQKTFKAYWDVDHWAIGFGSKASGENETITLQQARDRLSRDTSKFRDIVVSAAKQYGYDWDSNQITALTSFTYNLGAGNLNKLLDGGSRGDEEISNMILEYNKASGKVLPGLVKRRKAEAALFSSVN